jgi:ParB-like nuclease domain
MLRDWHYRWRLAEGDEGLSAARSAGEQHCNSPPRTAFFDARPDRGWPNSEVFMSAEKVLRAGRTKKGNKSVAATTVGGKSAELPISSLLLDEQNPRLPETEQSGTQDDLLRYIAKEYGPIEIAKSIASHGFFQSEPLIVVKDGTSYIVVEGNRRLAALLLLSRPGRAKELDLQDAEEWETLGKSVVLPKDIPVVVAPSRRSVAPIIGYRHISGIEPWDPYAKARYLASLIDKENHSFDDAASLVGETHSAVRSHYRNYRIATQAKEKFSADVTRARKRFGVFTRALQDDNLRAFLHAPQAAKVKPGKDPLPPSAKAPTLEFLSWVFGEGNQDPVLTDSRKLKDLGVAVSSETGLKILRTTRDLNAAFAAAGGHQKRVMDQLQTALVYLTSARDGVEEFSADESIKALVKEIRVFVNGLNELIEA